MTRVIVHLSKQEFDALRAQAARDVRELRDQARWLIVRGLAAEPIDTIQPAGDTQPEAGR